MAAAIGLRKSSTTGRSACGECTLEVSGLEEMVKIRKGQVVGYDRVFGGSVKD